MRHPQGRRHDLPHHRRGTLFLLAAAVVLLCLLYGCMAGAVYSPRGRLVFVPLAQACGGSTTLTDAAPKNFQKALDFTLMR